MDEISRTFVDGNGFGGMGGAGLGAGFIGGLVFAEYCRLCRYRNYNLFTGA